MIWSIIVYLSGAETGGKSDVFSPPIPGMM